MSATRSIHIPATLILLIVRAISAPFGKFDDPNAVTFDAFNPHGPWNGSCEAEARSIWPIKTALHCPYPLASIFQLLPPKKKEEPSELTSLARESLPLKLSSTVKRDCKPTATKVYNGIACAGETIFEEKFDEFRSDVWQIEQYIPVNTPNFPFVSYQQVVSNPTVSVVNGNLRISPKLQQDLPGFTEDSIYTGSINLYNSCTSTDEECAKQASGADILPPIVSGKITSKAFAFMYGTVTVRAKLPQGDWLYPEILLEPLLQQYGNLHYSSGIIQIASARGNKVLRNGLYDYSNKVLFGGPIMDVQCHDTLVTSAELSAGMLGDDFHEYSVRWTPDDITLSVDGEEWARVVPDARGLRGRFPARCTLLRRNLLGTGSKMAPFDKFFYLTLGVGAGSITEFPDGVTTVNGQPKPWKNYSRKALLKFWQNMFAWLPTWNQPEMLVDYVKVVAL